MNRRRKLLLFGGEPRIQGLLNTAFGAEAAAAYSLRMLNGDLIGQDIIEVKRVANSDFDRFKLTAEGIPQAQIASFCGASDGIVSWLQDQSGRGFAISQTAESACPLLYESGEFNQIKGKPALRFAGSQFLQNTEIDDVPEGVTFFNLVRAGQNRFFSYGLNALIKGEYGDIGNVGVYARITNESNRTFIAAAFQTNPELRVFSWNGESLPDTEMLYKRNGNLISESFSSGGYGVTFHGIRIGLDAGGVQFYTGFWNELITYHTDRLADIPAIESNILEHYDLP